MARGWAYIDEGKPEPEEGSPEFLKREAKRKLLMEEWSTIHEKDEQEGWRRQGLAEGDPMYENDEPDFEDDEQAAEHAARQEIEDERRTKRRIEIEEQLAELNARPMRPYEHWNEDEAYMQWMECGRFGEDPG